MNRKFGVIPGSILFFVLLLFGSGQGMAAKQDHAAVPDSGLMIVYLRPQWIYFPKAEADLPHSYHAAIASLPINEAMLSALQSSADDTPWISRLERGRFLSNGKGKMDLAQYRDFLADGSFDAIVLAEPVVEFTPGLKGLMVATRVIVQENTPAGPVTLRQRDITETVSLKHAGPPLSAGELADINAGDKWSAARVRASIWFANQANRVRTALLLDLAVLKQNLRVFLTSSANK